MDGARNLEDYRGRRDFERTPEPRGGAEGTPQAARATRSFVVQQHDARRLHHDLRLELDGVLKSWAVPRTPPTEAGEKALAVRTEDHPLEYGTFEGVIPAGEYGAGAVLLWDRGTWEPEGDPGRALEEGELTFRVRGERLRGRFTLVRMRPRPGSRRRRAEEWLLVKRTDHGSPGPVGRQTPERSVATGRTLAEIAAGEPPTGAARSGEGLLEAIATTRGARPGTPSERPSPQLATLVDAPPQGVLWLHEIKHDGYRILAAKDGARVRLLTRRGQDWTERFPRVAEAVAALPVDPLLLDGEAVVLTDEGRSDFQALQGSFGRRDANHVLFAFDLLHAAGHDLTGAPLVERKALLARLLGAGPGAGAGAGALRYGDHVLGEGSAFHREACRRGLEGTVSKRTDARYGPGRTRTWLKTKCGRRQELVVVGWTEPAGSREHLGALLLARRDERDRLLSAGRVGSGLGSEMLAELAGRLRPLEVARPPVADPPSGAAARGLHWVRPELVVEVAFREWTADGKLRQPTFLGVREDRSTEVVREVPEERGTAQARAELEVREGPASGTSRRVDGVRLTSPDRVLWPGIGLTKRELAAYHEAVADQLLPHVAGRALTLVRCPRGHEAPCFFQKHLSEGVGPPVRGVDVGGEEDAERYVAVDDLAGLLALVQLGTLELHPWGSRADRPDLPDRVVFDLDPGEGVRWAEVVATARVLGERLEDLGLCSWPRTTGGKGLHVVAPIARRSSWDDVKGFAGDVARAFARAAPERYVTTAAREARRGRIYLDTLRNDRGSTAIASWSPRARPGAPVAMPLRWEQLDADLDPARFTVRSVPGLLAAAGDPWEGFQDAPPVLTVAMRQRARRMR